MTNAEGDDVESRKVSSQTFGIALTVVALLFGWIQWAITSQTARIAVAEAKAESAAQAASNYNFALSLQLSNVQNDVKWIREKITELDANTTRASR